WTLRHTNHFTRLEQDLRLRLVDTILHATQDRISFGILDWQRAISGTADEAHDFRGFFDQMPGLVINAQRAILIAGLDLHENVAREELALAATLLAAAHFDDFLSRNEDV